MSIVPAWQGRLREAEAACRAALEEPPFHAVALQMEGRVAECERYLEAVSQNLPAVLSGAGEVTAEPHTLERWLLIRAALAAVPKVVTYPICDDVKVLWADEAMFFVRPPTAWLAAFSLGHVRFSEMAKIATLRRFPAGQFHWEMSGLPRSYVLRTGWRDRPKLLAYVLGHLGGFAPMAEIHVNDRRKNRLTLTEAEGAKSYYLLAKSLELQPEVRGLFTESWLYCDSTATVSPRLAWLRQFLLDNGAILVSLGPAAADSGFLVGSEERRSLYDTGKYRPKMTYALWSRRAMLAWACRYHA